MANFILSAFSDEGGNTLEEQITVLKENNIPLMEPRGIDGVNISDYTEDMAKDLKKTLDENGIKISAIGSPFGKIGILDDFHEHFEKFKRCVENACILDTKRIRLFSFYIPNNDDPAVYRDEVLERLEKMADYSLKSGVSCCHENEKGIYGDSDDRCLQILSSLKDKIKGVFDPANFIQCGVDILPAYEKLSPYIDYFHVKDALKNSGQVVPAGEGDGKIKELLTLVNKKDGDIILTIEPHLKVFDGLENLEKDGETAKNMENTYVYKTNKDAFKAASSAVRKILSEV